MYLQNLKIWGSAQLHVRFEKGKKHWKSPKTLLPDTKPWHSWTLFWEWLESKPHWLLDEVPICKVKQTSPNQNVCGDESETVTRLSIVWIARFISSRSKCDEANLQCKLRIFFIVCLDFKETIASMPVCGSRLCKMNYFFGESIYFSVKARQAEEPLR